MKIALAQIDVVAGRPDKNVESMLKHISTAKSKGCNLVVFSELCVSGYLCGDKWTDENFCNELLGYNEVLREASDGIAIIYGNIYIDTRTDDYGRSKNKDGRSRKYNAAYIYQNKVAVPQSGLIGELLPGIQIKALLPNYRMFDDERYFFSLTDLSLDKNFLLEDSFRPFLIKYGDKYVHVGVELCEDLWCSDYRLRTKIYNPTKYLLANGSDMIVNISASPWTCGKNKARDRRIQEIKTDIESHKLKFKPFFYVNCVGAQNNGKNVITFDGGSTVYGKDGLPKVLMNSEFKEELKIVSTSFLRGNKKNVDRQETRNIEQKYNAIIRGLQHIKDMNGVDDHPKVVLGLSGGIDSAVVAALCVKAFGADKVHAINMPSRYNSDKTKDAALRISLALGITYTSSPIENIVEANALPLQKFALISKGVAELTDLQQENVQAKIRGTSLLSNMSAIAGGIFTNNGNKLEVALGYATLYGDVGGAIAPIADLTKVEVFEMAKYLNILFGKEVIPSIMIPDDLMRFGDDQIKPSAELKTDQIDPMKFGYHDALLEAYTDYNKKGPEDILQWWLNGTLHTNLHIEYALLERWNLLDAKVLVDDLEWFTKLFSKSVFKRVQSPPIIITSKSSFGYDLRESQLPFYKSKKYQELEKMVLDAKTYIGGM